MRRPIPSAWGIAIALAACDPKPATEQAPAPPPPAPAVKVHSGDLLLFQPLPDVAASDTNPLSVAKTELGRLLYYDTRFSKNHDVSCNTCHGLDSYGVDHKPVSEGHRGQKGARNAPSVYNAAGQLAQFWDGRAADVEQQALGPVLNPVEMALPDAASVVAVLTSIPDYVTAFRQAFPGEADPVTFENFGRAVGAFERTLLTPAPWDQFLKGDVAALTDEQKQGFNRFVETGCVTCHQGAYVGGTMYKKLGEKEPFPELRDRGRAEVTHSDLDAYVFKVPTLRNVAQTAPYFHDGSIAELTQAVKAMAQYQLGKSLSDEDVARIAAWLEALTGTLPDFSAEPPALPPSGPKTPPPNPA